MELKIGDVVKIDIEKIKERRRGSSNTMPDWYSNELFTIIDGPMMFDNGCLNVYVDKDLPNADNTIWVEWLTVDKRAMRRKKLYRLGFTSTIDTEV